MAEGQQIDSSSQLWNKVLKSGLAYFQGPGSQSKVILGTGDRVRSYAIWCGGIKSRSKVWSLSQKAAHRPDLCLG